MHKYKINLETNKDIIDFVNIATTVEGYVHLMDGEGFKVNGKSLLGAVATVEWDSLYCESENDIYSKIEKYIAE